MKRKFIVTGWALASALGLVAISGCGGSDSSTTVASNSSPAAAAPAPTPSGPAGSGPAGSGSSAGPASGPPAGYGPPGGAPGSSEGSSGGAGSSGMQMQFDNDSGEGMVNSGGGSSSGSSGGFTGEMAGASSGIGMPEGYGEGMVNSGGGSSAGTATPGGPYGGGPKGGAAPNSGGGINPGQMAQYGNSGGQQMSSGASAPSLPSLDGSSGGGIGAPMGAPNGFGGIGGVGGPGQAAPPPTGPQKPEEDAPYLEKAKYAFAFGREPDAYKFALAHALSGAEDANVVLDEIQWVKDLMSPNSGISFAIGMDLKAPSGISDYKPVGTVDPNAAGGGGGGSGRLGLPDPGMMGGSGIVGGPGIGGGGGGVGRKDDPETFSKATGEMGRAFVRMFEERFLEGKFGKLFLEVENAAGSMGAAPAGGAPGFPGGSAGIGPSSGFEAGMEGGLVSPGGRMGAPGMAPGAGAPAAAKKTASTGHRLTPGLAYIGTGSMGELKTKASKDGFDCLVFFDVQVEQNKRNGRVNNDTRVQIVSLKTGKIIASSKKLNNYEVQKRMEDGDGDGIDAALQVVFSKLDEQLILSPLPSLKPDVVQKRISDLINSKQVPTLKALGEVCLFHHLKLINDEERTSAYELLLEGADGNVLGTGSVEDKRAVLDKLMPKL